MAAEAAVSSIIRHAVAGRAKVEDTMVSEGRGPLSCKRQDQKSVNSPKRNVQKSERRWHRNHDHSSKKREDCRERLISRHVKVAGGRRGLAISTPTGSRRGPPAFLRTPKGKREAVGPAITCRNRNAAKR